MTKWRPLTSTVAKLAYRLHSLIFATSVRAQGLPF